MPSLLRSPFGLYWGARVASSLAFQMLAVAVGWQVYALTGRAFDLGLVGLAQFLPQVLLTLAVGHAADRYDRRRIMALCQGAEALAAAALALGSVQNWLGRDAIFVIVALVGAARAFEGPSASALLPGLVAPQAFQRATVWSTSATQTATIVGPAIGGLLYVAGPAAVYGPAGALFLAASLFATRIRLVRSPRPRPPATLTSLFSGITFIWERQAILGAISLDLFSVLLGGVTALLPIFAHDILHTGPWGLGMLRSAPAIGALAMSALLARRPLHHRAGMIMFAAVGVFGLATIVFGLSTSLPLSLAALATLGAADVISVVVRLALVQMRTPDEMRGRVSAVNSLFIGTSNQLGEFESGMTAALFGAVPAVVLGGLGTILVALAWLRLFPELRQVDRLDAT
jgi:MFS family permease